MESIMQKHNKKAYLAGGCFWGESCWEHDARPCQIFYELVSEFWFTK